MDDGAVANLVLLTVLVIFAIIVVAKAVMAKMTRTASNTRPATAPSSMVILS